MTCKKKRVIEFFIDPRYIRIFNYKIKVMKKLLLLMMITSCSVFKPRPQPRYCVVVQEVIYKKNNTASIRPRSTKKGPEWWVGTTIWFRYPNHNIHVGDTVEVTMNDAIGPRF